MWECVYVIGVAVWDAPDGNVGYTIRIRLLATGYCGLLSSAIEMIRRKLRQCFDSFRGVPIALEIR